MLQTDGESDAAADAPDLGFRNRLFQSIAFRFKKMRDLGEGKRVFSLKESCSRMTRRNVVILAQILAQTRGSGPVGCEVFVLQKVADSLGILNLILPKSLPSHTSDFLPPRHLTPLVEAQRRSSTPTRSMPVGHAEARNIVFPDVASAIR
jgi:hypothetical protein